MQLFHEVARCTGHHAREQGLVLLGRGEHEAAHPRCQVSELAADLHAAAVGQPDVHERDVDVGDGHTHQRLPRVRGLPGDSKIRRGADQPDQASPDEVVVVHQEHTDLSHGVPPSVGSA